MRREIDEIPVVVSRLLSAGLPELSGSADALRMAAPKFLVTVARGSSDHAATYLKYAVELLIGVPVASVGPSIASVYAAEFKASGGACLAISQSGKSPDILALVQMLRKTAGPTIVLSNDASSPLAALADYAVDILAGPELSVAATKSFVASVVAGLMILAIWKQDAALVEALEALPEKLQNAAQLDWPALRHRLLARGPTLILGRGPTVAIAAEAALKLKETCAIHAEAYSTAEVMHGPVEVVDVQYTTLCFAAACEAEVGVSLAADQLAFAGAVSFITSDLSLTAAKVPYIRTGHALTDPLALMVTFYATIERLSRELGRNPDRPMSLKKVTETV